MMKCLLIAHNENRVEEDSEEDEEKAIANIITEDFENDERIVKTFTDLQRKYVVFGDEDRKNVIILFEVVREIAINRDYKGVDYVTSSAVVQLLSEVPYYSQISERTLRRWYSLRSNTDKKPRRKINESFKSEIWGNLMMSVMEKNTDEVSKKLHSALIINSIYK